MYARRDNTDEALMFAERLSNEGDTAESMMMVLIVVVLVVVLVMVVVLLGALFIIAGERHNEIIVVVFARGGVWPSPFPRCTTPRKNLCPRKAGKTCQNYVPKYSF